MHEFSLIKDFIHKITIIAHMQHARKVLRVTVKLGALSHISPEHFQEHFVHAYHGTLAEGAQLNIIVVPDITDPQSQEVMLENIEVVDWLKSTE
ncbi:MAG: hydrogenase maturation nickel metallochaperone HypA [Candidatus Brocadiales bacterium]|nr:hydrogenase maturation nickel metallochaperone HypA [Candidatus Brocadiales bacterium]